MVSEEGLKKFNEIYKKRYGVELQPEELFEKANNLLNLYIVVLKPNLNINKYKNEKEIQPSKN